MKLTRQLLYLAPLAGRGRRALARPVRGPLRESELVERPLTPTLMGARLSRNSAANSSPPPCGEGSGVGVARGGKASPQPPDPPPQPSPTRGEGVAVVRSPLNLAPMTPTLSPQAGRGSSQLRGAVILFHRNAL